MRLLEFFGKPIAIGKQAKKEEAQNPNDDLFWYILDHDKLHKDYFMPIGRKMSKDLKHGKVTKDAYMKSLKPMVEKGCVEFYHRNKMKGKLSKAFPKELRDNLCERLCDHYLEALQNNEFQLGD